MANQNHGIVQDERGQDQPASKRAAHRAEPTVPKDAREFDPLDVVERVHEPLNDEGKPQPEIALKTTSREPAQSDADKLPEADVSDAETDLPEGLRRPRVGPDGRARGGA
jgi:hypothetical protein